MSDIHCRPLSEWRSSKTPEQIAFDLKSESLVRWWKFERGREKIENLCLRFGIHRSEVDDVVQDICVRSFQYLPSFRNECNYNTWVFKIGRSVVATYNSDKAKQDKYVNGIGQTEVRNYHAYGTNTTEMGAEINLMCKARNEAVAKLSADDRYIFALRTNGSTYDEIATIMEIRIGTVGSRLFRIMARVREELKENGYDL